ncbi:MAG: hypothetical protein EA379_00360 [Phycisphaerales bacterium]|nr:MAG: hypothetical protein EA379_00360 [Phycisphaerales bacterium]
MNSTRQADQCLDRFAHIVRRGVAVLLAGVCAFASSAAELQWVHPGAGVFQVGANWQGGVAPGSPDTALFAQPMTHSVTLQANAVNNAMRARSGDVTLQLDGRTLSLQNFFASLFVADTPGSVSKLRLRNGAVQSFTAYAGDASHADATIDVGQGAVWTNTFDVRLANAADSNGLLRVRQGGVVNAQRDVMLGVQRDALGRVIVEGNGSLLSIGRDLNLGYLGDADVTVRNKGRVTALNLYAGRSSTSSGLFLVEGLGTTASFVFRLALGSGFLGDGAFIARDRAHVSCVFGILAEFEQSDALATIEGGAVWDIADVLMVGYKSRGTMLVRDEGRVHSRYCNVGFTYAGGDGKVIITDPGSRWVNQEFLRIGLHATGPGVVRVEHGAEIVSETVTVGAWGELAGDGVVRADVTNAGLVTPGARAADGQSIDVGTLHVDGSFTQESGGRLVVEVGGYAPGSGHDVLQVSGHAALGGVLEVRLRDGFDPPMGAIFKVIGASSMSGAPSQTVFPSLSGGRFFLLYSDGASLYLAVLQGLQPPPGPPPAPIPLPEGFETPPVPFVDAYAESSCEEDHARARERAEAARRAAATALLAAWLDSLAQGE